MLEIIILYFLTKKIGVLASTKGLQTGRWKIYMILAWIIAELFGAVIAVIIFGKDLFSAFLVAIACAASSYFVLTNYLNKLPDIVDENDVNNIGSDI